MVEYVIHGTTLENLEHILKSGKLEINSQYGSKTYYGKGNTNPKQIFTNILLYDLPNQEKQFTYWEFVGIVLDKRILKDKKWYATHISNFFDKFDDAFDDAFVDYNEIHKGVLAINRKEHASRIPSIAKLKNKIIWWLKHYSKENSFGKSAFTHSHELLFGEDISLEEYGICILVNEKLFNKLVNKTQQEKIQKRCNEIGIQLIQYKPMILGINKTIDVINSAKPPSRP